MAVLSEEFLTVKDEDREGYREFLQEIPEHFNAIETNLLSLDSQGAWDPMKVFRPFHTLKSLFGYLGFPALSELAHKAETQMEPFRSGQGRPNEYQIGRFLKL